MGAKAIHLVLCVFLLAGAACASPGRPETTQHPAGGPETSTTSSLRQPGPSPVVETGTPTPPTPTPDAPAAAGLPFGAVEIARVPRGRIEQIACSPDGSTVAVATVLGVWLYDTQALGPAGHLADVVGPADVDFSPDGRVLVTASAAGTQLWDVASGALQETVAADHLATRVAFSPEGRFLALGEAQAVTLWDLSTSEARHTWAADDTASSVAFSDDGRFLAATFQLGSMRIWDTNTGALRGTLDNTGSALPAAFAPDGRSVAAAVGEVRVWDAASGDLMETLSDWPHVARSVAFAPDAALLASGGEGEVRIWDLASGQAIAALEHPGTVEVLAFCGDGGLLVAGGGTTVRLWDVASQELRGVAAGFAGPDHYGRGDGVQVIALSPQGEMLASGHGDGHVFLWDLLTGELAAILDHGAAIGSLSFSPKGTHLASGGTDGAIRLWDVAEGVSKVGFQQGAPVRSMAFSPDEQWLAAAGNDGLLKVWDVGQGEPARMLLPGQWVRSVAFSPDGRLLASAGGDGFVRLWDVTSDRLSGSLRPGGSVEGVIFRQDGKLLASVRGDGAIGLWDVATRTLQATLRGFRVDSVGGVAFSPDGSHLLVVEPSNGQVDVWDTATGELTYSSITRRLDGSLALSADSTLLALGSLSGTVLLRGFGTGRPAEVPPAPASESQPAPPGEMVLIPAGEFQMGCVSTSQYPPSCREGDTLRTIYLDAYAIDRHEVTNAQYTACVADGVCLAPDAFSTIPLTAFRNPAYADHPVGHVSWFDAQTYCTWAGKRLPTEAEWVKAARGGADARIYPWGNEPPDCSRTTFASSSTGKLEHCVDGTSPVGSYPAGASPYGVMDMCGSVGEWVGDWYQPDYHHTSPDRNPPGPASGTQKLEFGSHMTLTPERVRLDQPMIAPPGLHSQNLGFRCARSAAPGIPEAATPPP